MKLLIDAGNSALKWSQSESGSDELLHPTGRIVYGGQELANQLDEHWQQLKGISSVWMANVAGDSVAGTVEQWTLQHWQLTPQLATTSPEHKGIINAYTDHTKLGIDRWLTLLAARKLYPGKAVCIIDCGTAITADLVSANGEHKGGLIVPGPALMKKSLVNETSAIDHGDNKEDVNDPAGHEGCGEAKSLTAVWGENTRDAIKQGVDLTCAAFILRTIDSARQQFGQDAAILITGGASSQYLSALPENCKHHPDLVLQGLALIAEDM